MVVTGIRVGELCKLRIDDISPGRSSLRVHGKGSRDRVAYISDSRLRFELQFFVQERRRRGCSSGPVFVNRYGPAVRP
jgi:site-specific recombinase XerD